MPVCGLLKLMRRLQKGSFLQIITNKLQANRQPIGESRWDTHCGDARQARRNGKNVLQVHLNRIACFFTKWESGGWRCWAGDHIDVFKGFDKVFFDESTDFLSAMIKGIKVAGAERESADQDAFFNFLAKSLTARALIQILKVLGIKAAMAVTNAVKPSEVRRALSWRNYVVSTNTLRCMGQ